MSVIATFQKDPSDVLDYIVDWTSWLGGADTIATSAFTVPTGLTMDSKSNTTTTATVWISSGIASQSYTVENTITTAGGRTASRSFQIVCLNL